MQYLFGTLTFLISVFLILLILVQRGRGGGLAGALGGMGGQSAFGTKAGDLFTRITMVVATVWILLSVVAIKVLNSSQESVFGTGSTITTSEPPSTSAVPGASTPAAGGAGSLTSGAGATPEAPATGTTPAVEAPAAEAPATSSTPAVPVAPPAGTPAPASTDAGDKAPEKK